MTTYVLVHGAWHGAWCWKKVVNGIEDAGHRVITPELPGSGEDRTPPRTVTLEAYAEKLTGLLDQVEEKVVMLGHSMGGLATSSAAEQRPEKVSALVYLSGFLPRNGQSLLSLEESNPKPAVPPALEVSEDGITGSLKPDRIRDIFYHDCSEEDAAFAIASMRPQPLAPLATPVSLTDANFGSVPRYYIECLDDHAICIEMQRKMIEASPCEGVFALEASHSPFFSMPEAFIDTLLKITEFQQI